MPPRVLEVKDLATRFHMQDGIVHAVNGVSFDVEEGETLGIVGESGCGKSVSVLSVMRLLPQPPANIQAVSIRFGGKELVKASEDEMRNIRGSRIAMVFQEPMTSLNPVFTVGDRIAEASTVHENAVPAEIRNRCVQLLKDVCIPSPEECLA